MKLSQQSLLVLDLDPATDTHSIRIAPSLSRSFSNWSAHTRVSPVWLYADLDKAAKPEFTGNEFGLAFVSSVNPAAFASHFGADDFESTFGNIWISLGVYNLVIVLPSKESGELVRDYCEKAAAALELWQFGKKLPDHSIVVDTMTYCLPNRSVELQKIQPIISEIDVTEPHFKSLLVELSALLAMGSKRSAVQTPTLLADFETIAETAFQAITSPAALRSNENVDEVERAAVLSELHNINAGLSRLTSQALSGSTPISKTECHFWPHSLLGIGTANRALRNIVAFIGDTLHEFNFEGRSEALLDRPPSFGKPSRQVPFAELGRHFALDNEQDDGNSPLPIIPITYFSGRDGFKNSAFTTSAPLLSISAGNSYQFSLVTITHEISHRIVASQIASMLDKVEKSFPTFRKLKDASQAVPASYAEVFFAEMFTALNAMAHEHLSLSDSPVLDDPRHLPSIFHDYGEEFEEHLVHVFDFWYFFNRDPVLYITTIWCSWAVLPGIASKIEEYVIRTLIALASNRTASQNWLEETRMEMLRLFQNQPRLTKLHLASEVVELLTNEDMFQTIIKRVNSRQNVIRVFHMILKSQILAASFSKEELVTTSSNRTRSRHSTETGYGFDEREFSSAKFSNPIRFLNRYASDEKADPVKSAWVLMMLAFNMHRKNENG
ncbi:hypothetical protein [Agrobacterium sp. lyk4-40-TYG-31]|uniref:hypothetical protein n=1 Tax=Agrobacterium sp. lyk4-40-TYG-31 TaxID=3040276 RepID=UPI00254F6793|nr:hypothetical protein [Agrobacterium sp. lyk4-40-TYG-31]